MTKYLFMQLVNGGYLEQVSKSSRQVEGDPATEHESRTLAHKFVVPPVHELHKLIFITNCI